MSATSWDHTVDLLIVGSGAGAMGTAISAHDRGGKVLLIEKTHLYGAGADDQQVDGVVPAGCAHSKSLLR